MTPSRVLALSPHPDDVELGCGGTIARLVAQGAEVTLVRFSDCGESMPNGDPTPLIVEADAAAKDLGVARHLWYHYQVRQFSFSRQAILDLLVHMREAFEPDLVLAPAATDDHQDHATVHAESIRAFKHVTTLGYELPWNNRRCTTHLYVTFGQAELGVKIEALRCFDSQRHRRYMSDEYIKAWAYTRGVQAGIDGRPYAEAFEVLRAFV